MTLREIDYGAPIRAYAWNEVEGAKRFTAVADMFAPHVSPDQITHPTAKFRILVARNWRERRRVYAVALMLGLRLIIPEAVQKPRAKPNPDSMS